MIEDAIAVLVGIIVIVAWLLFYIFGAIAVNHWLGAAACYAFIAFFIGLVFTKLSNELN